MSRSRARQATRRQPDLEHVITRGDPRDPNHPHEEIDVYGDERTARYHVQHSSEFVYTPGHDRPRVVGRDPAAGELVYVTPREVTDATEL